MSAPDLFPFVVVLLLFALATIIALLVYISFAQARFYSIAERLGRLGRIPTATLVQPTIPRYGTAGPGAATPQLTIQGPGVVTVSEESDPFTAKLDGAEAQNVTWSVTPATAAKLSSTTGSNVKVTPTVIGAFTLTAAANGATASAQIAAIPPTADAGTLPFVGAGFGSIIIAILVVVGVIALALWGTISGEVVGSLFGVLLGYIFGATKSAASSTSQKSDG